MSNENRTAEEKQLAERFWAIYKEEDLKYGEDYHDAADVRILAERALNRFINESQSTISRLEKERDEWREHAECRQCTIVNQKDVISRLESENRELKEENNKLMTKVLDQGKSIRAGERLRVMDAASAINDANKLRDKIEELELIIHGISEGADEWKSKCADLERTTSIQSGTINKILEALEKARPHLRNMVAWDEIESFLKDK